MGNSVTLYTVMGSTFKHGSSNPPNPAHDLMADFFTGISVKTGGQFIHTQNLKLIPEVRTTLRVSPCLGVAVF